MKSADDEPVLTRRNRTAFTRSRSLDCGGMKKETESSSGMKKETEISSSSSSGMKKETEISSSSGMNKECQLIYGGGSFKATGPMSLRALRFVQNQQARVRAASI